MYFEEVKIQYLHIATYIYFIFVYFVKLWKY